MREGGGDPCIGKKGRFVTLNKGKQDPKGFSGGKGKKAETHLFPKKE